MQYEIYLPGTMIEFHTVFSQEQKQTLSKELPTPLYFQLYSLLKSGILDGTFINGAQLPTEGQLSAEFGVSRITSKRALDELAREGLVERHRDAVPTSRTNPWKPQCMRLWWVCCRKLSQSGKVQLQRYCNAEWHTPLQKFAASLVWRGTRKYCSCTASGTGTLRDLDITAAGPGVFSCPKTRLNSITHRECLISALRD